jgi:YVTN family beta-propeller protein
VLASAIGVGTAGGNMRYFLLGPLEARVGGKLIDLGAAKQRALFAVLLLHANETVSRDRLIDGLWGERPPAAAAHTVETYVSRLRKALSDAGCPPALITRPPGYMLRIDPEALDLTRFEALAREGRRALAEGNPAAAAELLQRALALFRGPPLDDVAFFPFAEAAVARITEMHMAALEDRIDADLAAGGSGELAGELQALVSAYPMRERFRGQLMLALYRAGRQADGLEAYRKTRQYLADELGVEPSAALRRLERAMLRQDPSLEVARRPAVRTRGLPAVARRLVPPLSVVIFVASLAAAGTAAALHRGTQAAATSGDALGIIDPRTGAIVADIPLHSSPGRIAVGTGAAWVTNFEDHTVSRIKAGGIRQIIQIGGGPSGIAVGNGAVWVADALNGTVDRIDPATDQVVQTIPVGGGPSGIAYGEGTVWVANTADHTVAAIDPATGVLTKQVSLNASPTDLAVGAGAVWATSQTAGEVFRIDPNGNNVIAIRVGMGSSAIAAQADAVWVANSLDGTVSRIDPSRDVVTATVQVGDGPSAIAVSHGAVWVANEFAGTVTRIDPHTPALARTIRAGNRIHGVAVAEGQIWVGIQASPAPIGVSPIGVSPIGVSPTGTAPCRSSPPSRG